MSNSSGQVSSSSSPTNRVVSEQPIVRRKIPPKYTSQPGLRLVGVIAVIVIIASVAIVMNANPLTFYKDVVNWFHHINWVHATIGLGVTLTLLGGASIVMHHVMNQRNFITNEEGGDFSGDSHWEAVKADGYQLYIDKSSLSGESGKENGIAYGYTARQSEVDVVKKFSISTFTVPHMVGSMAYHLFRAVIIPVYIGICMAREACMDEKKSLFEGRRFTGQDILLQSGNSIFHVIKAPFYATAFILANLYCFLDPLNGNKLGALIEQEWNDGISLSEGFWSTQKFQKNWKELSSSLGPEDLGGHPFYLAGCMQPHAVFLYKDGTIINANSLDREVARRLGKKIEHYTDEDSYSKIVTEKGVVIVGENAKSTTKLPLFDLFEIEAKKRGLSLEEYMNLEENAGKKSFTLEEAEQERNRLMMTNHSDIMPKSRRNHTPTTSTTTISQLLSAAGKDSFSNSQLQFKKGITSLNEIHSSLNLMSHVTFTIDELKRIEIRLIDDRAIDTCLNSTMSGNPSEEEIKFYTTYMDCNTEIHRLRARLEFYNAKWDAKSGRIKVDTDGDCLFESFAIQGDLFGSVILDPNNKQQAINEQRQAIVTWIREHYQSDQNIGEHLADSIISHFCRKAERLLAEKKSLIEMQESLLTEIDFENEKVKIDYSRILPTENNGPSILDRELVDIEKKLNEITLACFEALETGKFPATLVEEYLTEMSVPKTFGGTVELYAYSCMKKTRVKIINETNGTTKWFNSTKFINTDVRTFAFKRNHYEPITDKL